MRARFLYVSSVTRGLWRSPPAPIHDPDLRFTSIGSPLAVRWSCLRPAQFNLRRTSLPNLGSVCVLQIQPRYLMHQPSCERMVYADFLNVVDGFFFICYPSPHPQSPAGPTLSHCELFDRAIPGPLPGYLALRRGRAAHSGRTDASKQ